MKEDNYLLISGIQHFEFCRRQWGLIHIENQWDENYLTASGRIVHETVHNIKTNEYRKGNIIVRGLNVKSDKLGITGICDAVEFSPSEEGIYLNGKSGKWSVLPIEYKHGKTKANDCDRLQVAAQALCLEEMMCCQINQGCIFYHETRRREYFEITEEIRHKLISVTDEMNRYFKSGITPSAKPNKSCSSCSISELCLPAICKGNVDADNYIMAHIKENLNEANS